jgi:DNA polymerase I-like protein with 3'-5' exonuclease and polymerase domains
MRFVTFDVETTTKNKGDPYHPDNRLCMVGVTNQLGIEVFDVEYSARPYGRALRDLAEQIKGSKALCGFNIKFDLHWLARYGILPVWDVKLWDVQQAYFIMTAQKNPYPSLQEVAEYYGIPGKLDIVKTEYWDKGIDTPDVPEDILYEYLVRDVELTQELAIIQMDELRRGSKYYNNVLNASTDQFVTFHMERNGMKYDTVLSRQKGEKIEAELAHIDTRLDELYQTETPLNWNSGEQLSKVLYGGTLTWADKEPYLFVYKTPNKDGSPRTVYKMRYVEKSVELPRLVEPLKGTEQKKEGVFKVDEATLLSLKPKNPVAKEIIGLVLNRKKLEKKLGTYFFGIPKIIDEMRWEDDLLHGQLNHARAETGRLSSSSPNLQNMDGEVRECLITRFN